jgi:hypothetical protein
VGEKRAADSILTSRDSALKGSSENPRVRQLGFEESTPLVHTYHWVLTTVCVSHHGKNMSYLNKKELTDKTPDTNNEKLIPALDKAIWEE